MKRLGDAELEIMQIIWAHPAPMTSNAVLMKLTQRQWKLSTLMTTLERLADKGFLVCDRTARNNLYSAQIAEKDYKTSESKLFLEKFYGNSLRNLVTSLCDTDAVDKETIAELRDYLDRFSEEEIQ